MTDTTNNWHLDKRVPIALIVTLVLQFGGIVNPTNAATSILNSALSGKEMYLSGSFAI